MTHAVRIRLRNFCLAILPAGIVFGQLLLCPLTGLSQTPSFSAHTSLSSCAGDCTLALHGDLNNDGYEDLITLRYRADPRVLSCPKGTGAYTDPSPTFAKGCSPGCLGDFNGDGKLDLIAGRAHVYLGNGDGTFHSCCRHLDSRGRHRRHRGRHEP